MHHLVLALALALAATPATAQDLTARATASNEVAVTGTILLPDACWQAGTLIPGAPKGAPVPPGALPALLPLAHSGADACAMVLTAAGIEATLPNPDGLRTLALWILSAPGRPLPLAPGDQPLLLPID